MAETSQEPTVSNNKVHIPLILVLGFILSLQMAMAVWFYTQLTQLQTSSQDGIAKTQGDLEKYKASIDLKIALSEQSLKVTLESLQEMKSDLKAIRAALQERK